MRILRLLLAASLASTSALAQDPPRKGVFLEDIDKSVAPCTDFYEFANGKWRKENPIPASMVRWSRRFESGETTKDKLRDILQEVAAKPAKKGSVEQLIGDHYASCMDEQRINARGAKPLEAWFKKIDAIKDRASLQDVVSSLHDVAVGAPFNVFSSPDNHNPDMVIAWVFSGGIGFPDRDYYFKPEDRYKEARERYRAHIGKMFELVGYAPANAKAAADAAYKFEEKLAEASFNNVELRNPKNTDNKVDLAGLQKLAPSIDWKRYFDRAKVSTQAGLNVYQPKHLQAVERQVRETALADWKHYLKWRLLTAAAPALSAPIEQEDWAFKQQYLSGAKEMKPRWKRCVESTDQLLGEALGQKYTEKYFPPAAKERMREMVSNLLAAMKDDIQQLEWMGPETKQKALRKLSTFRPKLGYPDKWLDYSSVPIRRDAFFENVTAGLDFLVDDDRKQIGKPVDRDRWGMTPPTSNAYYNPPLNEIVFPAGILQPPGFNMEAVDAVNYGAIGVVIGHEISHGFDDQGAQYDADGKLNNWWTEDDLKKFRERGACVVDQFNNYFIEPGLAHNGKLSLGESIGDLAGAKIAYMAWKKSLEGKPAPPPIDGYTHEQLFFIAWGQFRGDALRIEEQRRMVQGGAPHPIGKYRVIGPLSNTPEFGKAFSCKVGDPMVRSAEKRCEVW
jgi:putative endopeptidase